MLSPAFLLVNRLSQTRLQGKGSRTSAGAARCAPEVPARSPLEVLPELRRQVDVADIAANRPPASPLVDVRPRSAVGDGLPKALHPHAELQVLRAGVLAPGPARLLVHVLQALLDRAHHVGIGPVRAGHREHSCGDVEPDLDAALRPSTAAWRW